MKKTLPGILCFAGFIILAFGYNEAKAQNPYLEFSPVIGEGQANPLKTVIRVTFPEEVRTVGQAMVFLLKPSGWRLATGPGVDPAMATLLNQPLPAVQRTLENCPLWHALTVLAGPETFLMEKDPPNRTIAFTLAPKYRNWHRPMPAPLPAAIKPVVAKPYLVNVPRGIR